MLWDSDPSAAAALPMGLWFNCQMNLDWRRIEVVDEAMAEVLRGKTPAERIAIGFGLWRSAKSMLQAQLAAKHPEWDRQQVDREVARRLSHGTV